MNTINLGKRGTMASEIALGCMRINGLSKKDTEILVQTALENNINFFEHADIYGGDGACEAHFANSLNMSDDMREKMLIQTKCGICKGYFDFSKEHIINSVENSLKRLKTDYLDVLVLHRPDTLMEPSEVAEAFALLKSQGKVKSFGVSNQNPMQIELINKYMEGKLIVNQLQFSVAHTAMLDSGFNVNMLNEAGINRDGSVFDYCRLMDITVQAWSPFQYGFFEGVFIGDEKYKALNVEMEKIAKDRNVTVEAVAVAFILRHPAKIQTIVGTSNKERLANICKASDVCLTREEWYNLYTASGKILP